MPSFPDDVSVAIVAHNSAAELPATIAALQAAACPLGAIHVVDVASGDGTPDVVRREWPDARVTTLERNDGPNPARNHALATAATPYVLLLDSDVRVEPDAIEWLRAALAEFPRAAVASPLVVYEDQPDTIQYGGTWTHFVCEAVIAWQGRPLAERGMIATRIGCASGNALLVAVRPARHAGLFDEDLFMGKEDAEFTHRLVLAGYDVVEVPRARVRHRAAARSTWLFVYQIRNRWYFMLKNYELRTLLALAPALLVHEMLQFGLLVLKGHGGAYFKAMPALARLFPKVRAARARVAALRKIRDAELLKSERFVVRGDMADRPSLRALLGAYDRWLWAYWRVARRLLPR